MSTNFYLEKTCDLGCDHQIHVGKRGGNGQGGHRFTQRIYPPGRCEVPYFVVTGPAQIITAVQAMEARGWLLMSEYGERTTPDEMLDRVTEFITVTGEFS